MGVEDIHIHKTCKVMSAKKGPGWLVGERWMKIEGCFNRSTRAMSFIFHQRSLGGKFPEDQKDVEGTRFGSCQPVVKPRSPGPVPTTTLFTSVHFRRTLLERSCLLHP
jgi:hypothetical protein